MAIEIFLMPMIGTGTKADPFRGKYVREVGLKSHSTVNYGDLDDAIVLLKADDQSVLDAIRANPDATSLATETNIDNTLTVAQANAAKTIFEDAFVPNIFINVGDTRRQVIRGVVGMFLFSQRMNGRFKASWKSRAQANGITLNSTWADFPQQLKDELIDVRDSFGWSNLGITNSSTVRDILKIVSDQFENTPITMSGVQI